MLTDFGYLGLYLVIAVLFALQMLVIPIILRRFKIVPSSPNPTKVDTFECGVETVGKTWVQFNFHYYFYALVFLALDVLVVFLYPWAASLLELGQAGFIGVISLLFIVFVGYLYAWRKKVLEWK
ncbi:MAG: NADH-quinone oxidoreductase subunit A [Dehalococcoidales bacterium]|nr:NADH-quinone oxidoreductase subunit A [Dehalococcoidales bacterium]MDZ4246465.1 NADH-quinone oxidoreductase subunit A [Dehalococcoidia bacterium]